MNNWIRICVPEPLQHLLKLVIRVGNGEGHAGELIKAVPGLNDVTVYFQLGLPNCRAWGSIRLRVPVQPGATSDVQLSILEKLSLISPTLST
jgi:hypothetical protein